MLIALWPLVVCIIGLLVWALASNAKVSEAGKIAYFVGLFWLVYTLASKTLRIG